MSKIACALLVVGITITFISCRKNSKNSSERVTVDYFIVGRAGGFVPRPVLHYYRIGDGMFETDTAVPYMSVPPQLSGFNFNVAFPDSSYRRVQGLLLQVPAELVQSDLMDYGTEVTDEGFLDLRTTYKGVYHRWNFQGDLSRCSPSVQRFADSLQIVFN